MDYAGNTLRQSRLLLSHREASYVSGGRFPLSVSIELSDETGYETSDEQVATIAGAKLKRINNLIQRRDTKVSKVVISCIVKIWRPSRVSRIT